MPKSNTSRATTAAQSRRSTETASRGAADARSAGREPLPTTRTNCDRADAMFRAAVEACRQHARYARLVTTGACDEEQDAACRMATIADQLLEQMTAAYADGARGNGASDEAWWHRANRLMLASREYARRRDGCDEGSRRLSRPSADRLRELAADYELQASALLLLSQAIDGYREARPEADLKR